MYRKTLLALLLIPLFLFFTYKFYTSDDKTIKVGILHSSSGSMAMSEKSVIDATMFAIDEINQKGGLLGKKIEPIFIDGASKSETFYAGALKLIKEEKVDVVFGCWTSASRKTVKPIFEENNHLLIYPIQFEGLETSPNIFYTGLTPNQQVLPALNWALQHLGKKIYLVGSDYIYPKVTNAYIKDMLFSLNIEILGERYIPLDSTQATSTVNDIVQKAPDLIINTLNGESNIHFFKALQKAGISTKETPVLSFSLAENEYKLLADEEIDLEGHYAAVGYLYTHKKKRNLDFIRKFQKYLKKDTRITDPMVSAYIGVNLWGNAVKNSSTSNPRVIKKTILQQTFEGPDGIVFASPKERKLFHHIHLGKVDKRGHIQEVWGYLKGIEPITFTGYRTKKEWHTFLNELFKEYHQRWER